MNVPRHAPPRLPADHPPARHTSAYVVLTLEVRPDGLDDLKSAFRAKATGAAHTARQRGCRLLMPCVHAQRNAAGNYVVTLFEQWEKHQQFAAYLATPERAPAAEFMQALGPCLGPGGLAFENADPLDFGVAHRFLHNLVPPEGERYEYVVLTLEVLNHRWADFLAAFRGPLGAPLTARQPGCKLLCPCEHHEMSEQGHYRVTIFEMWHRHADFEAYMATPERAPASEFMAALGGCLGPAGLQVAMAAPLDLGVPHRFLNPRAGACVLL